MSAAAYRRYVPMGVDIWRAIDFVLDAFLAALHIGAILLVVGTVVGRTLLGDSIVWAHEAIELSVLTLAFVGGAIAYRDRPLPAFDLITVRIPQRWRPLHAALLDWIVLLMSGLIAIASITLVRIGSDQLTAALQIPAAWFMLPLSVGFFLITVYAVRRLVSQPVRTWVPAGVVALGLALVVWLSQSLLASQISEAGALISGLVLAAFGLLSGLPLAFVLMLGAAVYVIMSGTPLAAIPQALAAGFESFVIVAVPFFLYAGLLMAHGGISGRILDFALAAMSRLRAGLFHVTVVVMYLFSGISGSEVADMAAVGPSMTNQMRKRGYNMAEGSAVLAASAAMGLSIPPSIALLLMATVAEVSIASLFVAGMIPATVLAIVLMLVISLRREARPATAEFAVRIPWRIILTYGRRAALPLLMPVFLLGGIIFGVATPTEVATFAVLYGLFLLLVVYRITTVQDLWQTLREASSLVGVVLLILSGAFVLSWALTIGHVLQPILQTLSTFPGGAPAYILFTIVFIAITGAIFEGMPAVLVLAPFLIPPALALDINLLHYAMLLVLAQGIGAFSPPIGIGFYVACRLTQESPARVMRHSWPYVLGLFVGVVLVGLIPWLTLSAPTFFNMPI